LKNITTNTEIPAHIDLHAQELADFQILEGKRGDAVSLRALGLLFLT